MVAGRAVLIERMVPSGKIDTNPQSPDFRIEDWPFYGVVQLAFRYNLRLDAVLKPIGMDTARWRVLMVVSGREYATVTEIADIAVTRLSTMAKIVQRMVGQNLVSTRPSVHDARAIEVTITDQGRMVLEQIRSKVARVSQQAFEGVSTSDLQSLKAITRRIHDNLLP